ncbi:hypothetical protein EVAR_47563_1 [Eumeta japonica]|uniref:Uncharacterized protein n=1 Tax=Eumeta variegata TaxID=151549 RepID=A0A4C1WNF8_EUMVA|nr:hypothetical protein EVAR_47563_1 [Eumeta japonica]
MTRKQLRDPARPAEAEPGRHIRNRGPTLALSIYHLPPSPPCDRQHPARTGPPCSRSRPWSVTPRLASVSSAGHCVRADLRSYQHPPYVRVVRYVAE